MIDIDQLARKGKPIGNRFLVAVCLGGILLAFSPSATAQPSNSAEQTLTEDDAVRRALAVDKRQRLWDAQIATDEADAKSAAAWPNPTVGYTRDQSFEEPDSVSENFVLVEQTLPLSGQRGLRADAARKRAEAARFDTRAEARQITTVVRHAFYQALTLQRQIEIRRAWLDQMSQVEGQISRRVQAGESAPYELERLRREMADVVASIDADEAELARLEARLVGMLGLETRPGELRVTGEILPEAPPSADQLRESVQQRPEIVAAQKRAEAASLQIEAASRWWVPEPAVTGGYKGANVGGDRFHGFVIGVGLSLPLFDRQEGERMAAEAALVRAESRQSLLERRLSAEILGLARQVRKLEASAQTYQEEGVERAQKVLDVAQQAYDSGEVGILELIDAYRGAVDSRLRRVDLAARARARHIELQQYLDTVPDTASSNEGE